MRLDWGLITDTPVANYHILFMNKKASSSGAIKPPMAEELLEFYTPEQLRAHWLSLGLDQRAVSFSPKAFDTSVSRKGKDGEPDLLVKDDPRVVDPALKESAFLTNIFNRMARSCCMVRPMRVVVTCLSASLTRKLSMLLKRFC